jgi:hypothetical protein
MASKPELKRVDAEANELRWDDSLFSLGWYICACFSRSFCTIRENQAD